MKRPMIAVAVLAVTAVLGTAEVAWAAGPVDQSQAIHENTFPFKQVGQVVTVGVTGNLDQVDIGMSRFPPTTGPLTVEVRTVSGGEPTNTVLASATVESSTLPMFNTEATFVAVPIGPVAVTAGTQIGIVITRLEEDVLIAESGDATTAAEGPYAGGAFMSRGSNDVAWFHLAMRDMMFQTHVTPPPPPPPAPSGVLSGPLGAITALVPALAPIVNPLRSLLGGLGL